MAKVDDKKVAKPKKEKKPMFVTRVARRLGWEPGPVMREVIEWTETLVVAAALAALIMTFITVRMHVPTGSMIPTIDPKDSFFVDRITYYFRLPKPGDIVVFRQGEVAIHGAEAGSIAAKAGVVGGVKLIFVNEKAVRTVEEANAVLAGLTDGTAIRLDVSSTSGGVSFNLGAKTSATTLASLGVIAKDAPTRYVKRLIAVGGQTVQIKDGSVYVDNVKLTGSRFARTYVTGPRMLYGVQPTLVPEGKFFMLGDNSTDSLDSRYWGFVDRSAIIGVPYLRVWPLNRFGTF